MAHLAISLLGSLQVSLNQRAVTSFKTTKVQALLAYLAVEAHEIQQRQALAGLLWPNLSEKAARNNLRQSLFRLRQAIKDNDGAAPFLTLSRHTVQLNPESNYWLDVTTFHQTIERSRILRDTDEEKSMQLLAQAVNLYQGEFLADMNIPGGADFQHWVYLQREKLHQIAVDSLDTLVHFHRKQGQHQIARRYAEQHLAISPLSEEAHRQMMYLYAIQGERDAAMTQYEVCTQLLHDRSGVAPSRETVQLQQRIVQGDFSSVPVMMESKYAESETIDLDLCSDNQPPIPETIKTMVLPSHTSPFLGYEEETAVVSEMLQNPACRLLTLTGLAGSGKSAIALEVAWQLEDQFTDGVCFVKLTKVHTSEMLLRRIADSLGLRTVAADTILHAISEKRILLVLDGFDSIRGEVGLLRSIMRHAPNILLLVTSRSRLNLSYEWVFEVDGLAYPQVGQVTGLRDFPAVQLFLQSARRENGQFEISLDCWPHIARITRAVEGNPLAIRQAAGWTTVLDCHEIATEIEQNLSFLNTPIQPQADVPSDLQLRFEEFWQLLTNEQQRALRHLSVFTDKFSQEAAEAVAQLPLVELFVLKGQSLVRREGRDRYRLPTLLRHLAYSKLCERPLDKLTAETRFAQHFAKLINEQVGGLQSAKQSEALDLIEHEMVHIDQMWQWGIDRCHHEILDSALEGLFHYYAITSAYSEGEERFKVATQRFVNLDDSSRKSETLLGRLLTAQGWFVHVQDRSDEAKRLLKTSVSFLQSHQRERELVQALNNLAAAALAVGDSGETQRYLQQSLEFCQIYDDLIGAADALMIACEMSALEEDWEGVLEYSERSLMLRRMAEDSWGMSLSHAKLGDIGRRLKQFTAAKNWYEKGLQLGQDAGFERQAQFFYRRLTDMIQAKQIKSESLPWYPVSSLDISKLGQREPVSV